MTIDEVQKKIEELSGNNAGFYASLTPGAKPIHGVRVPEMRKIAKEVAKGDYRDFLENNPMDSFELEMISAAAIGYIKNLQDALYYFEWFMPKVHDWSVSDTLCQTFKIASKYPEEVWSLLEKYFESEDEFIIRIVAITLMSHFLTDTYIDKVINVLNSFNPSEYYSKMGIAWAVATVMAKYPEKCMNYMISDENRLDDWTFNKSIQKMKESYRVTDEMKAYMEKIKR